jgi:MFS family permease
VVAARTARPPAATRRLLLVVSAIVFCDTTFYAVVAPLLPRYSADLDLSKASAGLLLAAYPAGMLLGALPTGMLAERIGPRRTVLVGLTLMGAASVGFAVAQTVVLLDLARAVQGVGAACSWAGGLAWLMDDAPPERRGALIGTAMGTAIGGALLGPALGAAAAAVGTGPVFGAVAIVSMLLAVAAASLPGGRAPATRGAPVWRALSAGPVWLGMWLVLLPGLAFGVLDVLVPLRLDALGVGQLGIAVTFLAAAAVEALMSPAVGRLADRRGALLPIRGGLLAATVLTASQPAAGVAIVAALLLIGDKAALGAFWTPGMALLSRAAEQVGVAAGPAFGLVNLAWAIGMVAGAAGGGALAGATTDGVAFALVAGLCAVTLILMGRRDA